jgi:hypothetical protein
MDETRLVLLGFLILSIGLNCFQFYCFQRSKQTRPQSIELQEFLADISKSAGLIAVTRVPQEDFLLRSPRGKR